MDDRADWRLIRSGYLSGAMNMALDDVLLRAVATGRSLPVLRLYRWRPAALTIGYAQSLTAGIDLASCRAAGVDVVRRPTGGRAVLHDHEVTYAVVAPGGPPFEKSIAGSYRVIAEVLKTSLARCGLTAELVAGQPRGEQRRPVCFTAPAQHELLIAGCKVAGSAQKRRGEAFLQHGSLPLTLDLDLLQRLLPDIAGDAAGGRFEGVGWLQRFSARPLEQAAIEDALVSSFSNLLQVNFVTSTPTSEELALAEQLCAGCYGNPSWTLHGPGRQGSRPAGIGD
jgi:lipoate-protein ligase A